MALKKIYLHLGIDFGTKYTKLCFRDTGIEKSWLVIPGIQSSLQQSLILSKVGIQSDGFLVGGLSSEQWSNYRKSCEIEIDFLKMRLANLDYQESLTDWFNPNIPFFRNLDIPPDIFIENLCIYFLFKIIQNTKFYIQKNDPDRFKNLEIEWSSSIGVPLEYYEVNVINRFRRVLCLAWQLSNQNFYDLTIYDLNNHLTILRSFLHVDDLPHFAFPELAAGIISFLYSPENKPGLYSFVDIGGGTVEGATFLYSFEGEHKLEFLASKVSPLGIDAIAKRVTTDINQSNLLANKIVNNGKNLLKDIEILSTKYCDISPTRQGDVKCNKHNVSQRIVTKLLDFRDLDLYFLQILILYQLKFNRLLSQIIHKAYKKLPRSSWSEINLFWGGGGNRSAYYYDNLKSLYESYQLNSRGIPTYHIRYLPKPKDLTMWNINVNHFHRFAIAYGLSIPDYEFPSFFLPKDYDDIVPPIYRKHWVPDSSEDDG